LQHKNAFLPYNTNVEQSSAKQIFSSRSPLHSHIFSISSLLQKQQGFLRQNLKITQCHKALGDWFFTD